MTRLAAVFVLAACSAETLLSQQQAPPTFRVQVDAVEMHAFVTDAWGKPVTDLTIDDFEVLEDGRPQTITSFALVNVPFERREGVLHSPAAIEPDVQTNSEAEGRLYVIALDEVPPALALRTRKFLRRFIEQHFAANDIAAIVCVTRCRGVDMQDFTSNPRLLLNAIDSYVGGGLAPGPGDRPRALRDLLEFMETLRGRRKAMLWVTQAAPELKYDDDFPAIDFDDTQAALAAAVRGNVSIYPIDPAGLDPGGGTGENERPRQTEGGRDLARMASMRALAAATGGFALLNSNNFDAAFERIVRETSSYYMFGFTSTDDRRDRRYRRVEVRVKRPGLQVRAGDYIAPARQFPAPRRRDNVLASLSAPVAVALSMPVRDAAVPMAVFAAAYKGTGRDANVAIAIEMDASRLDLVKTGGSFDGEIEVATAAVSAGGKVVNGRYHRVQLALKPDTFARAQANGLRVLSEIELPPGRYQLRIAVGNTASSRAGSVMYDLEVPDFTKGALVMSAVSLTSTSAADLATSTPDFPLHDLLPGPVTAAREFRRGDTIALYAEVYENGRNRATHTVDFKAELRSDAGHVLQTATDERSSKELDGTTGGYGFSAQLSLDVDPGIYVLHVEARSNSKAPPTVSRDIQIRVK